MKPLVAIPTFNEEKNVLRVIDEIRAFVPDVLVIDDASSDATPDLLKTVPGLRTLRHPTNMGYGQSLIDAFEYAADHGFDWVITMDADGQHEAESLPLFLRDIATGEWDLISGSRYLAARSDDDLPPPERRSVNHRITKMLNNLFGLELTDSFCGFKAHRTRSMLDLNLTERGYAFPLQLWPRVWEYRLRLRETPVRRIYNDPNRSFGTHLDDVDRRLHHYVDVLNVELNRLGVSPVELEPSPAKPRLGCGCH
jgi:glycosyltransferase involved in cell wall biosynthesis